MFSYSKNINLINLLIKTLVLVKKSERKNLFYLVLILTIQSVLDVLSIASIIPLLYLLESKEKITLFLNNFLVQNGIDKNFLFEINLSIYIPLIVGLVIIITTLSRLFIVYKTNQFIEQTRYSISSRLMNKYIINNYDYTQIKSEVAKSILSEVDQFIIIVFQPVMWMLTNLILLIGIIFYLIYTNLSASIFSLSILGIFYFLFFIFTRRILNLQGIKSENSNKGRFKTAIEIFESIKDIKIYSAEKFFSKRFRFFSREFANTNAIYSSLVASPKYLLEMIVFMALSIAILILTLKNSISSDSIPLLATFAFAAYKAQPALSNVIYGINSLEYGSKIISNLYDELNLKQDSLISKKENKSNIFAKSNPSCLIIKNMTYKYNDYEGIENICLEVDYPSLIVIAGESGSGKSTLLNIIAGLQKPQKGEILFNKEIFNKKSPKISYLHQNYSLFDASVAENVAFGIEKEKINYKLLKHVLQKVGILEYIQSLENSFHTNVGEKGSKFSVGQAQRISIARALYFEPEILILDEPTSALDKENAKEIIKTIIDISKKITVIITSHQINYFPKGSNIFFLDKNK